MGDAEKEEEEKFLEEYPNQENVDYIKLGHHGSKTSTTQELLDKTKPKKVFISSGKNNLYGHPSKETIQLLEKNKIEYENTQDVGRIKMK